MTAAAPNVDTSVIYPSPGPSDASGPGQTQLDSAYTAPTLASQVTALPTGVAQLIVPTSGLHAITASDASAGYALDASGDRGATIAIEGQLPAGHFLWTLVGQEGGRAVVTEGFFGSSSGWAGGGGDTFIEDSNTGDPILVTGGGGGAAEASSISSYLAPGVDASPPNITFGGKSTGTLGSWGHAGSAAQTEAAGFIRLMGEGRSGFSGNGAPAVATHYSDGTSFLLAGFGGANEIYSGSLSLDVPGGLDDGVGARIHMTYETNAGGDGGYSGDRGGSTRISGGGGNFLTETLITSGFHVGNGSPLFDLQSTVPEPATLFLITLGIAGLAARRCKVN